MVAGRASSPPSNPGHLQFTVIGHPSSQKIHPSGEHELRTAVDTGATRSPAGPTRSLPSPPVRAAFVKAASTLPPPPPAAAASAPSPIAWSAVTGLVVSRSEALLSGKPIVQGVVVRSRA